MTGAEALAAAVRGEDAAVYAYGLVGAALDGSGRERALAALSVHRARRDAAADRLAAAGQTPPPAAAAYDPPFAVTGAAAARRLAALVENRLAPVYADLAGASTGAARTAAAGTAAACAVAALGWGGAAQAFPG